MELLIAFLIGIGAFTTEEAPNYNSVELKDMRIEYHSALVDKYDTKYTNIFGTDETEVY